MNKAKLRTLSKVDRIKLRSLGDRLTNIPIEEGLELVKEISQLMVMLDFTGEEVLQADILTQIGVFYGTSSMTEEAEEIFQKLVKLAIRHSLRKHQLRAESNLAICKAQLGNYHEAIEIWKTLADEETDKVITQNILNNVSVGYGILGEYHMALNFAFKALDIAQKANSDEMMLSPLMNLSTAYEKLKDYDKARKYVDQALFYARKLGNVRRECECLNNLSLILNEVGEQELALERARECLTLRQRYYAKYEQAISYNNIGYIMENMGKLNEALKNYKMALKLSNDHTNQASRTNTYLNTVSIYLKQNKADLALRQLDEVKELVHSLKINEQLVRFYGYYSQIYAQRGDFESAYNSQAELNAALNELYEEHVKQSVNKSEADYFRKRIEEQAELYKEQNKELKKKNRIIHQNSIELSRSNKNMQDSVETLNWIVSVISHDVRAPLGNFSRVLELILNGSFPEDEKLEILHSMRRSSQNMYKLVDEMLDGIRLQRRRLDDITNITNQDIIPHLQQIYMIYQPIAAQKNLTLDFDYGDGQIFALIDSDLFKIVVRNLLNNAVKFSFDNGRIGLSAKHTDKQVIISISDTGVGMRPNEIKELMKRNKPVYSARREGSGIGLGWILCRDSVKKMKGSLEIESEPGKGSTITIKLPSI